MERGRSLQETSIAEENVQRKKKTASERRSCGYTKLCENYATGSKSSDIREEVRFKTLPLLNTLPDQKKFHQIQSIAVGKKKRQS